MGPPGPLQDAGDAPRLRSGRQLLPPPRTGRGHEPWMAGTIGIQATTAGRLALNASACICASQHGQSCGQYVPRLVPDIETAAGCYGACSQNAVPNRPGSTATSAQAGAALLAESKGSTQMWASARLHARGCQDPCADREAQRKQQAAIWSEMSLPPQAQPWSEVSKGTATTMSSTFMFRKYRRAFSGILSTGSDVH